MVNATSYISEHSVEFILVPKLKEILHTKYKYVIPIFPHMGREGSNIAKHIHKLDEFTIIGLYPRRPKVTVEQNSLYMKINTSILEGAKIGLKNGIPIIAGLPLAMNYYELDNALECLWIKLDQKVADYEYKIEKVKPFNASLYKSGHILYDGNDILEYIADKTKLIDYYSAIEIFKQIKTNSNYGYRFGPMGWMGGYKPVYFLLKS